MVVNVLAIIHADVRLVWAVTIAKLVDNNGQRVESHVDMVNVCQIIHANVMMDGLGNFAIKMVHCQYTLN